VRGVAGVLGGRVSGRVVVALVEAEVLCEFAGVGSFDDDRLDRRFEQFGVVGVGAGELESERAA